MTAETTQQAAGVGLYRLRAPIYLQAIQWTGDNEEALLQFAGDVDLSAIPFPCFLVRGITGQLFTVDPDRFADLYEAVPAGDRIPGAEVGVAMIRAERARQVAVEGYTPEHDTEHTDGELALAAVSYALAAAATGPSGAAAAAGEWPFAPASFKPGPKPIDSLVKAGALCAAEIDRIVAEETLRG